MSEKNALPLKQRMAIVRARMPEVDAAARSRNFEEVNRGLPPADAMVEATRCIECAKPGCVEQCPVGVKVKEVVALIHAGDYLGAAAKLREDNALPAITGRVCPQEHQCEGGCVLGRKGAPLALGLAGTEHQNCLAVVADHFADELVGRTDFQAVSAPAELLPRRGIPFPDQVSKVSVS